MCLLLLLVVIFVIVLITLQLKSGPDAGSLHLVGHTKPIECRVDGRLDGSVNDLSLGGGRGGRRNEGTSRGRWRNKGRGGGAVRKGNGDHGRSGDGESNHFCIGFEFWLRYTLQLASILDLSYYSMNEQLIISRIVKSSSCGQVADVSILASSNNSLF